MTIAELQGRITEREFLSWVAFYRACPFDDRHRYHRPAALIAHSMGGADIAQLMDWLQPEPLPDGLSAVDMSMLKAFGVRRPT